MKQITKFISKETNEEVNELDIYEKYRKNFTTYDEFENWRDENFIERTIWIESPYERTRASVYATGNRWAIENFNATH